MPATSRRTTGPAGRRRKTLIHLTAGILLAYGAVPYAPAGGDPKGEAASVQSETSPKRTNRLADATSPYLLQHAENPVNWYEWGNEAFAKAREEDKPVFLSIGYAACHWCHVMEHESFEDQKVAEALNENFVAIKVDREERPDIDEIYMQATLAMTGHGGWPMSVFMTPDGRPFIAGTYYPRDAFIDMLDRIASLWKSDRDKILDTGSRVNEYLQQWADRPKAGEDLIPESALEHTTETMSRYFDMNLGGFKTAGNKFPPSMWMDFMLRRHNKTGTKRPLEWVDVTLTKMANGGIYDHLGGGICRYSTDPQWLVPHFEKMLYDQGLVGAIYVDAFQVTDKPLFEQRARGIFDYVIRDLQSPEGGFYSSRDADSEGLEGKFYVWTVEQVNEVLGPEDAKLFCAYYDVTESGNWFESRGHAPEGPNNILNVQRSVEDMAKVYDIEPDELEKRLETMREEMFRAREQRVPPGLDNKILTGWNGLMIAALAKGGRVLDEPRYTDAAVKAADFVLTNLRKDGGLLRTCRNGEARLTGYLSDYAFLTEGLLNLYEATFDARWIRESVALTDDLIERFHDEAGGGFFFTAADGERLIARTKDADDGAIPSGNSVTAMNLLRLAILVNRTDYREKAESIFRAFASLVEDSPAGYERMLCAVDLYHDTSTEIAVVGAPGAPDTEAMLRAVFSEYRPNKVVAFCGEPAVPEPLERLIPLLKGKRQVDGQATGYVCENYKCKKPVTTAADLSAALAAQ